MKRRLIPMLFGFAVLAIAAAPLYTGLSGDLADQWTLALAAMVFVFKSLIFGIMRYRMIVERRPLTVFGVALVDFFGGLTLLSVINAIIWLIFFGISVSSVSLAQWQRHASRAALAGFGAYVVAAGVAVLWEMRRTLRAGGRLEVHHPNGAMEGFRA